MPTSSQCLLIASLVFVNKDYPQIGVLQNSFVLLALTLVLSYLLIAEIPMISLKFKNLTFKDNMPQYILLVSYWIVSMLESKWHIAYFFSVFGNLFMFPARG